VVAGGDYDFSSFLYWDEDPYTVWD
jgi:hypothetical protein